MFKKHLDDWLRTIPDTPKKKFKLTKDLVQGYAQKWQNFCLITFRTKYRSFRLRLSHLRYKGKYFVAYIWL